MLNYAVRNEKGLFMVMRIGMSPLWRRNKATLFSAAANARAACEGLKGRFKVVPFSCTEVK